MEDKYIWSRSTYEWGKKAQEIFQATKGNLPTVVPVPILSISKEGDGFRVRIQGVKDDILVDVKEYTGMPVRWGWRVDLEGIVYTVPKWGHSVGIDAPPEDFLPDHREIGRLPKRLAPLLPGNFGFQDYDYVDLVAEYRQRLLAAILDDALVALPADE